MKFECGYARCTAQAKYRILLFGDQMPNIRNEFCTTHIAQGLEMMQQTSGVIRVIVEAIQYDLVDFNDLTTALPSYAEKSQVVVITTAAQNYPMELGIVQGEVRLIVNNSDEDVTMDPRAVSDEPSRSGIGIKSRPLVVRSKTMRRVQWQEVYRMWFAF